MQALVALAERADCDVRSCLNTLQFLAKRGGRIKTADITSLNMGQKDMTKGAFAVWTQLFSTKVNPLSLGECAGHIEDCVRVRRCATSSHTPPPLL